MREAFKLGGKMRGLTQINRMNDVEAAGFKKTRYEKLRDRAILRKDWDHAQRYDGYVEDHRRFLAGEISVFPDRKARESRQFKRSVGRDFRPVP